MHFAKYVEATSAYTSILRVFTDTWNIKWSESYKAPFHPNTETPPYRIYTPENLYETWTYPPGKRRTKYVQTTNFWGVPP